MKEESMKRFKELSAELTGIAKEERIPLIHIFDNGEAIETFLFGSPIHIAAMIDSTIKSNSEISTAMGAVTLMGLLNKTSKDKDKED